MDSTTGYSTVMHKGHTGSNSTGFTEGFSYEWSGQTREKLAPVPANIDIYTDSLSLFSSFLRLSMKVIFLPFAVILSVPQVFLACLHSFS
jgi:hypothetical protein